MAYRCLLLCGLFFFKGFCKSLFQIGFDFSQVVSRSLHCEAENLLLFRVSEIAGMVKPLSAASLGSKLMIY